MSENPVLCESEDDSFSDGESVCSSVSSSTGQTSAVYVGKFPPSIKEHHLKAHFKEFHQSITKVVIIRDKVTGISKGFGFVYFDSDEVADKAITLFNKSRLLNEHCIKVQFRKYRRRSGTISQIWVGNLSSDSTPDDLMQFFGSFKDHIVKPIVIKSGKNNSFFTYIGFSSHQVANKVVSTMNGRKLKGKKIRVEMKSSSKTNKPHTHPTLSSPLPLSPLSSLPLSPLSSVPLAPLSSLPLSPLSPLPSMSVPSRYAVVVSNIPRGIEKSDLNDLVSGYGPVIDITCNMDCATLTFLSYHAADEAAKVLNGQNLIGQVISAEVFKVPEPTYGTCSSIQHQFVVRSSDHHCSERFVNLF